MAIGADAYILYGQSLPHNENEKLLAIPRNKYNFDVKLNTIANGDDRVVY